MSELKCPFCNQELRKISATSFLVCDNCNITGFDKLWQELIRTRKALEIAWDALIYDGTSASKNALDKIKTITTLEQKDIK